MKDKFYCVFTALNIRFFFCTLALSHDELHYNAIDHSKIAASTCFRQFPADFITFTEEILHEKLHFLCIDWVLSVSLQSMTLLSDHSKIAASTCFSQFLADFITFTEEILHGKLHFLCSDWVLILSLQSMTLFSQLSKIAASTCFRQFPADFITFTEEIINGKLHFLCSDWVLVLSLQSMTLVVPVEFLFPWKISICSQRWK